MMNKNERMEKLNEAGINTGKYFNIDLPNGLKPGATISLVINENGEPMVVADSYDVNTVMSDDHIAKQIIADGYVRNTKLHRRFVMAQMFQMLNYKSYDGKKSGYNDYLKHYYGYDYTIRMMIEEVYVLNKLEARDRESFEERSHFFTKDVVIAVLEDYMDKLKKHIETLPDHKCKGIPYKKIKGTNIFNADIKKRIYDPLTQIINWIRYSKNYAEMYRYLHRFTKRMIKLPYETPKSKVWIDAFKGAGAYYTLKNLIMYHNCVIKIGKFEIYWGTNAMRHLKCKLDEYKGEGWRMFALMKKVIADNNFNFQARMAEIYNK